MVRPKFCRKVSGRPAAAVFKPAGIPNRKLEQVVLTLDEFEAIRLADLEGLYHFDCAKHMNVSRPTFSRILDEAHRKIAEVLVLGKALRIEGGNVLQEYANKWRCGRCAWQSNDHPPSARCPRCHSQDLQIASSDPESKSKLEQDRSQQEHSKRADFLEKGEKTISNNGG